MAYKGIDLCGQRFGRLLALADSGGRKGTSVIWVCQCDCGKGALVQSHNLRRGATRSCGCLIGRASFKHGDSKSRLYKIWDAMKQRCFNPMCRAFKNYGNCGITICGKWRNDYLTFKAWAISHGYESSLTIDRINNNKGYEPENCQWLSRSENSKKPKRGRGER